MFYTSVYQRGDKIYHRGYDKGLRTKGVEHYRPYMFVPKAGGKFKTLDGKPVERLMFDSISEARDFCKRYDEVANYDIYGLNHYLYLWIFDNFKGDIDYDPKLMRIGTLDIECAADDGFPDIQKADKEITAITVRYNKRNYSFGCGSFVSSDPNTHYIRCKDEYELLQAFLQAWDELDLDIVTGWNVEFFDVPYLVNRIRNLFSDKEAKRLSPWRILDEKYVEVRGKDQQTFTPAGISVLDYYALYRKFKFGNQESYKLDYICQEEIGEKKIDYTEYGDLLELYKNNFQKFMEYNIHDCVLVERLDDKLKFLEQVMALAFDAKVNFNDTMTTVRPWDIIIHNYLLERNIVIPQFKKQFMDEPLVGGYVKEPQIGLHKWVISFDLNSLYPHLIMQYNISPEKFAGRLSVDRGEFPSINDLVKGFGQSMDDEVAYAANGCMYLKDSQGFLPALMERMYNDRTRYKKLMLEAKQRYENTKSAEDEKLVARYHNMQMAKKIQLNSAYGALGNLYFRWFNFNHAEAVTTSGQLSIRWIERKMNEYMNKTLGTKDYDYVVASDTDSIYVCMDKMVQATGIADELIIVDMLDKFCELKIQPYIDECYMELANQQHAFQQKMQMKRETIANKGIWRGAKMYILNCWNVEGVQYKEPKLKVQGIEAVRSSTPHVCRQKIKESLTIIMNGNEDDLIQFINKFKEEFLTLPYQDVAFPRGLKGMTKYNDAASIYKKGTPIQTKGALLFNHMLKKHGIKNIQPLADGDKIRFAYLKLPNPVQDTVIATSDELPSEFKLDKYIDRDMQFEKSFLGPIRSIANVIGWNTEYVSTLEDFFG